MQFHHIFGMKRSGHHAFVKFLINQYPGKVGFRNRSGPERIPSMKIDGNDATIIGYEDHDLNKSLPGVIAYAGSRRGHEHLVWVILRSPFNCFASRLRNREVRACASPSAFQALWINHAELDAGSESAVLTRSRGFALSFPPLGYIPPVRHVYYDRWFSDKEYRRHLASMIGQELNDEGRDELSKAGSSFDEYKHKTSATQMDVLNRWKYYKDDPEFWKLFTPRIRDLAVRRFGVLDAEKEMRSHE